MRLALLMVVGGALPALAAGLGGEVRVDPLTLAQAKAQLQSWISAADLPDELAADLSARLAELPDWTPLPLLGGWAGVTAGPVEFNAGAALITDDLLRRAGLWPEHGVVVADPGLTADAQLMAYHFELGATLGLDLGLVLVGLESGADLAGGRMRLWLDSELADQPAALPGEVTWSSVGVHLGLRVEVGIPLLRLFARGGALAQVSRWSGCPLAVGPWYGAVGLAVRF
ncbi:MAG: hypothetical protein ACP5G2_02620 [Candidatus Bipolaricaulaceae bacterium]